jgi:hypothetical protein
MFIAGLICGLFGGAFLGVLIMALCFAGSSRDDKMRYN